MQPTQLFPLPSKGERWTAEGEVAQVVTAWNAGPRNNGVVIRHERQPSRLRTRYGLAEFLQRFRRDDFFGGERG